MKFVFTLSICLGFSLGLVAQSPDCYKKMIDMGDEKITSKSYKEALNLFIAARGCNPKNDAEIDRKIDELFKVILELKEEALKNEKKAVNSKKLAVKKTNELNEKNLKLDSTLKKLKIANDFVQSNSDKLKKSNEELNSTLRQVEKEQAKNNRIINAFYFYGDSLALAVKKDTAGKDKYGFINKNGDTLIGYRYDEASNFNQVDGYARVKQGNVKYLLDTKGKLYPVAETVEEINASTIILDLHDKQLTKIPPRVFRYRQLEMILLHGNQLTSLPTKLGKLTNLRSLDLRNNKNLRSLPAGLGKLTNLQTLYLKSTGLKSLPAQIGNLSQLQNLNLEFSKLESLPPEIGKLRNLQMLNLAHNPLKSVPVQFWELRNLQNLNVNSLPAFYDSVPDEIKNFKKLQELNILGDRFAPEVINKIINSLPKKCNVHYSKAP